MSDGWTDNLAGARMQVDQQFNDRILDSRFTNQEWGLIMTAVDFNIENPDNPGEADLVADTDDLEQIIPELANIQKQMGGSPEPVDESSSGGLLGGKLGKYIDALKTNSRGGNEQEKLQDATALVQEYTDELQHFLEEQGRWSEICALAADSE